MESNVKLEGVSRFCYLSDMLGAGGGGEEAARARVRCAWAKFKELSPILTVRGASYNIKSKINRACVHSVLTLEIPSSFNQRKHPSGGHLDPL